MKRKIGLTGAAWLAAMTLVAESVSMIPDFGEPGRWRRGSAGVAVLAEDGPTAGTPAIRIVSLQGRSARIGRHFNSDFLNQEKPGIFQGISFHVKGDGSDVWTSIALGGDGYRRYVCSFPLKSTEWTKFMIPWEAFVPEEQYGMIGDIGNLAPWRISWGGFGHDSDIDRQRRPRHSFSIADLRLEPVVPPLPPPPAPALFQGVLDKLKSGEPVRIQCMGDATTVWINVPEKKSQRYAALLGPLLERHFGYTEARVLTKAVYGPGVNSLRAWVGRDFAGEAPDLVTVWLGFNDKTKAYTAEYFRGSLAAYLDDIARVTGGRSAILLFTTTRGSGGCWEMQDDFAAVIRQLAADRELPCFDINAIQEQIGFAGYQAYLVSRDRPNVAGHEFIARELVGFLLEQAGLPRPPAMEEEEVSRDSKPDRRGQLKK